jgi:hypothetical protein
MSKIPVNASSLENLKFILAKVENRNKDKKSHSSFDFKTPKERACSGLEIRPGWDTNFVKE